MKLACGRSVFAPRLPIRNLKIAQAENCPSQPVGMAGTRADERPLTASSILIAAYRRRVRHRGRQGPSEISSVTVAGRPIPAVRPERNVARKPSSAMAAQGWEPRRYSTPISSRPSRCDPLMLVPPCRAATLQAPDSRPAAAPHPARAERHRALPVRPPASRAELTDMGSMSCRSHGAGSAPDTTRTSATHFMEDSNAQHQWHRTHPADGERHEGCGAVLRDVVAFPGDGHAHQQA